MAPSSLRPVTASATSDLYTFSHWEQSVFHTSMLDRLLILLCTSLASWSKTEEWRGWYGSRNVSIQQAGGSGKPGMGIDHCSRAAPALLAAYRPQSGRI